MADAKMLAKLARTAITDEWHAHFQYWIGSIIMSPQIDHIVFEFREHAENEFDHATKLGMWLRNVPRDAHLPYALSELKSPYCGYIFPAGNQPYSLVADAIKGEQCAIEFYTKFIEIESETEHIGSDLARILREILDDEKDHLIDLQKIQDLLKYHGQ